MDQSIHYWIIFLINYIKQSVQRAFLQAEGQYFLIQFFFNFEMENFLLFFLCRPSTFLKLLKLILILKNVLFYSELKKNKSVLL